MSLISVPVEVVDTCLLPYLHWNDLLRLRRTCKKFKDLVDDYIRKHPEMAPELEINEKEKSFRAFLAMGIPSRKIFLNNESGNQFYRKEATSAAKFLEDHGPLVTHLRMEKFSVWCTAKGKQFLEMFPNLISFEAAQTALKRGENRNGDRTNLPTVFERLQVLKLYQSNHYKPGNWSGVRELLEELLRRCRLLQYFCIPFFAYWDEYFYSLNENELAEYFEVINSTIRQRNGEAASGVQGPLSRIHTIEFSGYPEPYGFSYQIRPGEQHIADNAQQAFHRLASVCFENNVKLFNVRGQWFSEALLQGWPWPLDRQLRQLGNPLVSLTSNSFSACLTRLDMRNLETLKLTTGNAWLSRESSPCNLPMLKTLALNFNWGARNSEDMCRYFFEGVVHEELTELEVSIWMLPRFERVFVGRLAERLVSSCPHLKTLTICGPEGDCQGLVAMLEAFETLEEVNFIECAGLKNADFVGPDAENPRFLRITSLRKLSFIQLDCMSKLSDILFSAVIRRMQLTKLKITSSNPIGSVTLQGVESLLEGPFSESIEDFSFEKWSLDQVNPRRFKALGKRFRCNNIV